MNDHREQPPTPEDATRNDLPAISRAQIKEALSELEKLIDQEVQKIDARVSSEKNRAPESYINDMKGFSRGMFIMGGKALALLKSKLLAE
jgi:hypothetical protein